MDGTSGILVSGPVPTLRQVREERGNHSSGCVAKMKSLAPRDRTSDTDSHRRSPFPARVQENVGCFAIASLAVDNNVEMHFIMATCRYQLATN